MAWSVILRLRDKILQCAARDDGRLVVTRKIDIFHMRGWCKTLSASEVLSGGRDQLAWGTGTSSVRRNDKRMI